MADEKTFVVVLVMLISMSTVCYGSCFKFTGNGRVVFSEGFNAGPSAHFKLKFKTAASTGILYYSEGLYHKDRVYDFEGVFLRDGYLHYFLFNPAAYSIGATYGFHGKSKIPLNTGSWHTVEFYRNLMVEEIREGEDRQVVYQTGLTVNGEKQASENGERVGVDLRPSIVLGEDPNYADRPSKVNVGFKGKIKDFEELTTNHLFLVETNSTGQVSHCIGGPEHNAV